MSDDGVSRRRSLPHIDVGGKPSFITACLHGSISALGLKRIRAYREQLEQQQKPEMLSEQRWKIDKHKLVFKFVDSILDGESLAQHLKDERLAEIVQNAILHFAGKRYHLFAYVVMPSHHHWVFLPKDDWAEEFAKSHALKRRKRTPREAISHSIQSFTGTRCNRVLGNSGSFWQTETFDHFARNDEELYRIINYIEQNPVAARLVDEPDKYRWSSAFMRKQLGSRFGDPIVP